MTLDQLHMLEKIVETGSILAASKALHISQPAVSVAMKKLEEELDFKIFTREQYRTTLTAEGEVLYQRSKIILRDIGNLQDMAEHITGGKETEIGIAVDIGCPLPPILKALEYFEKEFPHTNFNFSTEALRGVPERLLDRNVDFAIWPRFDPETIWKLDSTAYAKFAGGPVAAPTFPHAQEKRKLSKKEMKNHVQIIVKDSSQHSPKVDWAILEGGRFWKVSDIFMKKQIILSGVGWGGLPYHLIEEELKDGRLVPLEIEGIGPFNADIVVTRRKNESRGPVAEKLWEYFSDLTPIQW